MIFCSWVRFAVRQAKLLKLKQPSALIQASQTPSFSRNLHHQVYMYVSTSNSIYTNLALEDWIYNNFNFKDQSLLLLWRNYPTVVIGRHQNPWAECDIQALRSKNVSLARRRSGGGTVYHDMGNLNCTFFTSKKKYDRQKNLAVISQALRKRWNLDVCISDRDDLLLDSKFKISGTAAKLGGKVAYHHCTVLYNANLSLLTGLLQTPMTGLNSKATHSVSSTVRNLCESESSINYSELINAISLQYLQQDEIPPYEEVDPTDNRKFPGLLEMELELKSWDFIFGKTPKFTINRNFEYNSSNSRQPIILNVNLEITKGHISTVTMAINENSCSTIPKLLPDFLIGRKFTEDEVSSGLLTFYHENKMYDTVSRDLLSWIQSCFCNLFKS